MRGYMTMGVVALALIVGVAWAAEGGALELVGTLKVMSRNPEGQITALALQTNIGGTPTLREVTGDIKVLSKFVDKRVKVRAHYQDKEKGTGKILVIDGIEVMK